MSRLNVGDSRPWVGEMAEIQTPDLTEDTFWGDDKCPLADSLSLGAAQMPVERVTYSPT